MEGRKQLGAGRKCPPEEEDLVRSLLFRDAIEKLKCTMADIADICDPIKKPTPLEESKSREPQDQS